MSDDPIGQSLLIEVGLSYAEGILPTIETHDYDRLASALTQFLHNQLSYENCAQTFKEILGHDDPLIRVKEIINISNEPIPYTDEAKAADENPHNRKKTRTWGCYEDQRLIAGVYRYGLDNWPMVASFVGNGRTRAQCAQRWARGLNPRICKKHWSQAEDEQLKQLVQTYGEKSWTKIAAAFGNRSDVQCRYHYRQIVKGDEMTGCFMSLRRAAPMAFSSQSFYTPQFQIMQPQVLILPTVPIATTLAPSIPPQNQSSTLFSPYSSQVLTSSPFTLQNPQNGITTIPMEQPISSIRMSANPLPTSSVKATEKSPQNTVPTFTPTPTPVVQPRPVEKPTPHVLQIQPRPHCKTVPLPPPPPPPSAIVKQPNPDLIDHFLNHFK